MGVISRGDAVALLKCADQLDALCHRAVTYALGENVDIPFRQP